MARAAGKRGSGGLWLTLVLVIPLGLFVLPSTVLLLAGLIPTIVAYVVDKDPDKSAALTVGSMNLTGIAPFLVRLWQAGHTLDGTARLLADPFTWMVMFGAAAIGWLMYFFIPMGVAMVEQARSGSRIREMEAERAGLVADWGPEVMGRPGGAEPLGMAPEEDAPAAPATAATGQAARPLTPAAAPSPRP